MFILPADAGERITLSKKISFVPFNLYTSKIKCLILTGITILLALVVFLQMVADNLPPSDEIPLLGEIQS